MGPNFDWRRIHCDHKSLNLGNNNCEFWFLPEVKAFFDPVSDIFSVGFVNAVAGNNLWLKPAVLVFNSHHYTLQEVKSFIVPLVSVGDFLELEVRHRVETFLKK